jgi:monoamine oxidase
LIEAYLGGDFACELERAGPRAIFAFLIDELAALLGAEMRTSTHLIAATAWDSDPWARGSYSFARPGGAEARQRLATPVEDRLFFAGEACAAHAYSTVHGAWQSGRAAAAAVRRSLRRSHSAAAISANSSG